MQWEKYLCATRITGWNYFQGCVSAAPTDFVHMNKGHWSNYARELFYLSMRPSHGTKQPHRAAPCNTTSTSNSRRTPRWWIFALCPSMLGGSVFQLDLAFLFPPLLTASAEVVSNTKERINWYFIFYTYRYLFELATSRWLRSWPLWQP